MNEPANAVPQLTLGQKIILEREIARTYEIVALLISILRTRREVLELADMKALRAAITQLAEDVPTDRAKAALLSAPEVAAVQAVQAAVLHAFLGAIPEQYGPVQAVYEAANKAIRAKLFEES